MLIIHSFVSSNVITILWKTTAPVYLSWSHPLVTDLLINSKHYLGAALHFQGLINHSVVTEPQFSLLFHWSYFYCSLCLPELSNNAKSQWRQGELICFWFTWDCPPCLTVKYNVWSSFHSDFIRLNIKSVILSIQGIFLLHQILSLILRAK